MLKFPILSLFFYISFDSCFASTLSLSKCIELAKSNVKIERYKSKARSSTAMAVQAKEPFYPKFSLVFNARTDETKFFSEQKNSVYAKATQLLYDGGQTNAEVALSNSVDQIAKLEIFNETQRTSIEAINKYFSFSLEYYRSKAIANALELAQAGWERSKLMFSKNAIPLRDVVRFEVAVAGLQSELEISKITLADLANDLKKFLDMPMDEDITPKDIPGDLMAKDWLVAPEQTLAKVYALSPTKKAIEARMGQISQKRTIMFADQSPKVSLEARYGSTAAELSKLLKADRNEKWIGVNVTIPFHIFESAYTNSSRNQVVAEEQAQVNIDQKEFVMNLKADVNNRIKKIKNASKVITLLNQYRQATKTQLDLEQKQFFSGVIPSDQYIQIISNIKNSSIQIHTLARQINSDYAVLSVMNGTSEF